MKQQVNPAVAAVIAVVLLGVLGFFGWKAMQPATPTADSKPVVGTTGETVNGQQVPAGVPADYVARYKQSKGQGQTPP